MLQALLCTWHHLALQLSRIVEQGKSWVLHLCLIPSKCKEAQRPTATAPSGLCVPLGNLAATVKPRAKLHCPPSAIPRQSLVYFGFILSAAAVQWDQASHVPPPGTAAYAASSKNKERTKQAISAVWDPYVVLGRINCQGFGFELRFPGNSTEEFDARSEDCYPWYQQTISFGGEVACFIATILTYFGSFHV